MSRHYSAADLITLPRFDASGADALVTELLSHTKGKKLAAAVETARKALVQSQKGLQSALTARVQSLPAADGARAREADQAEDAAFSAAFYWLSGLSKLPDSAKESQIARGLLGSLFRDGLKFTQLPYKLEWAEADARLRAVDADESIAEGFAQLGGEIFLKNLKKAHKEYGEALGITSAKSGDAPSTALVLEPLASVRAALKTYILKVIAHEEADSVEGSLLAPLVAWQSRTTKAAKAAPVETPAAPAVPIAAPPASSASA